MHGFSTPLPFSLFFSLPSFISHFLPFSLIQTLCSLAAMLLTMRHQEDTLMYYTILPNGVSMHLIKRITWALVWVHKGTKSYMIMHLSQRGQTPLHFACKHGHIVAVRHLLTVCFADVSSQDKVCLLRSHSVELSDVTAICHCKVHADVVTYNPRSIKLWAVMTTVKNNFSPYLCNLTCSLSLQRALLRALSGPLPSHGTDHIPTSK